MDFGAEMRSARITAGLTQAELSRRSATSQATLSAYEHGRKIPSAATLARILAAAGHGLEVTARGRAVLTPSARAHRKVAGSLHDVLELAAALPSRTPNQLRYPRLPAPGT